MKYLIGAMGFLFLVFAGNSLYAQDSLRTTQKTKIQKSGKKMHMPFVDADGDGYNDNAPDDDGDGIPNGLDPDYVKMHKKNHFRDMNGDGIDDRLQPEMHDKNKGKMMDGRMRQNQPGKGMDGNGMKGRNKGHGKGRKGMH